MVDVDEAFLLRHADDNLVLAQRLGEYVTCAPDLEQDIAVANFALDHIGVAMHLYDYAADIAVGHADRDRYAMTRTEREFRNVLLVEQPHPDYAFVIARGLLFDLYQVRLWGRLSVHPDLRLAGIAGRAGKEARYHLRYSRSWMIRLGDGTEESHQRMQTAIDDLWRFTAELFESFPGEDDNAAFDEYVDELGSILDEATLTIPADPYQASGGRDGWHTEHLGHLLADLQWLARTHPDATW
ncbi:MAG: phenylacetate-CoA oxygenase subunit PaaC [Acidimicrobiia bacterium]|nr:phenylacetate-CoA oxygenase subunit PaaC [Acidimicrobiia bacterium]